jgi:crotonobetainyl-CoA:carnitine CoA-transferase CaiB-like acyl-CoA transferase
MWGTIGILAALLKRKETGKGGVVDVSLFETSAAWMVMHAAHFLGSGEIPRRYGSGQVGIAPYKAYQTKDGFLVVAAGNDGLFKKLCEVLKLNLYSDSDYKTNPERVKNSKALYAILDAEMLKKTNGEWAALLEKAGVPCAPVQNVKQMLEHEQTAALGLLQPVPGSSQPLIGLPVSFNNERPLPRSAAPALGAHTHEVLGK